MLIELYFIKILNEWASLSSFFIGIPKKDDTWLCVSMICLDKVSILTLSSVSISVLWYSPLFESVLLWGNNWSINFPKIQRLIHFDCSLFSKAFMTMKKNHCHWPVKVTKWSQLIDFRYTPKKKKRERWCLWSLAAKISLFFRLFVNHNNEQQQKKIGKNTEKREFEMNF